MLEANSGQLIAPVCGASKPNASNRPKNSTLAFDSISSGREFRGTVARISGDHATCVFNNVPAGMYAVAAFHAEQNEHQMQFGAFGRPKQGYGFSGNPSASMGPPTFANNRHLLWYAVRNFLLAPAPVPAA